MFLLVIPDETNLHQEALLVAFWYGVCSLSPGSNMKYHCVEMKTSQLQQIYGKTSTILSSFDGLLVRCQFQIKGDGYYRSIRNSVWRTMKCAWKLEGVQSRKFPLRLPMPIRPACAVPQLLTMSIKWLLCSYLLL